MVHTLLPRQLNNLYQKEHTPISLNIAPYYPLSNIHQGLFLLAVRVIGENSIICML
jgi:hypothetical protein